MVNSYLAASVLCGLLMLTGVAQAQSDTINGLWWTEDREAVVEFYSCDTKLCGRFYWLKDNDTANPSRDDNNPEPDKRSRLLCGLTFIGGFKETKPGHYDHGWIYSPRHGHNFEATISQLGQDRLELRGYVLTTLFGSSQIWQRVNETVPTCPTPSP